MKQAPINHIAGSIRNIIAFLLIALVVSCISQQDSESNKRIKEFENYLGKKETAYLNEIITDFDKFLESNYQGTAIENFKLYLNDIEAYADVAYFFIDSIKWTKYQDSKLFTRYVIEFPDSVWKDENTIKYKYPDFSEGEFLIAITQNGLTDDETIQKIKTEPRQKVITPGNFYPALEKVSNQDSLIINYLDIKEAIGNLSPAVLAGIVSVNLDNSSAYFAKRIFIMDQFD